MENSKMVNIVIFGVGKTYDFHKSFFAENSNRIEIVAFIDNNPDVQGKMLDGIPIYAPEKIKEIDCDGILILSNKFGAEMTEQLLAVAIPRERIWNFTKLKFFVFRGGKTLYGSARVKHDAGKNKILIITSGMAANGGTLVSVYAAQSLQRKGYEVMLAAPSVTDQFLEEIIKKNLSITVWECLPYVFREDEEWIDYYDVVIVNVFQMMNCAYEISKRKPVLWWIHENGSQSFYQDTQKEFRPIDTSEWMKRLEVLGVSKIAQEAFNHFYPNVIDRTLPFGIPDKYLQMDLKNEKKSKIIFAVIAMFNPCKGHRVLVEALKQIDEQDKELFEIWFIGPSGKDEQDLSKLCAGENNVKFLGFLSHDNVMNTLPQIDVLVCPSMIETMSMSTIEGMMFEKLCITTDMTGVAEYIENGKNGFVVKAGSADELAACISWIIHNTEKWDPIRKEARKTYENEFTLEKFGQRLEIELKICKENFYENTVNVSSTIS